MVDAFIERQFLSLILCWECNVTLIRFIQSGLAITWKYVKRWEPSQEMLVCVCVFSPMILDIAGFMVLPASGDRLLHLLNMQTMCWCSWLHETESFGVQQHFLSFSCINRSFNSFFLLFDEPFVTIDIIICISFLWLFLFLFSIRSRGTCGHMFIGGNMCRNVGASSLDYPCYLFSSN